MIKGEVVKTDQPLGWHLISEGDLPCLARYRNFDEIYLLRESEEYGYITVEILVAEVGGQLRLMDMPSDTLRDYILLEKNEEVVLRNV